MGLFDKVPSISVSFGSKQGHSSTSLDRFPTADSVASSVSSDGRGRSRQGLKKLGQNFSHLFSRSRSPSPAAFGSARLPARSSSSDGIDKLPRTDSLDAAETDVDSVCDITPNNAFDSETETEAAEDEEGDDGDGEDWLDLTKQHEPGGKIVNDELDGLFDPDDPESQVIAANTEANSSQITPLEFLQSQADQISPPFAGQAPNLTRPPPEDHPFAAITAIATAAVVPRRPPKRSNTARSERSVGLDVGRPIYERNRCTIVVSHGDQAKAAQEARKPRFYFVASDLSAESRYALEWCIGTCMRQGDECLFMTVMETDSKFDPERESSGDKVAKIRNQKDRQEKASALAREATALLIRTRLNVTVTCQAVHAKSARHILVDCIDWLEPTLVIVGSRGLSSLKGTLMGSVSHYLVQKSSVPVMVARKRLRAPPKVYKKRRDLDRQARVPLDQAAIEKESHNKQTTDEGGQDQEEAEGKAGEEDATPTAPPQQKFVGGPIAEEPEGLGTPKTTEDPASAPTSTDSTSTSSGPPTSKDSAASDPSQPSSVPQ